MFLHKLVPDQYVESIFAIDIEDLHHNNIRAVITDLDNTLVEWYREEATPEVIAWLARLRERGMEVTVVSNNRHNRVERFCTPLGVKFISAAKKPTNQAFIQATNDMNVSIQQTVVIGDQLFTDVLGGNRLGFHTILVVPVTSSDGFFTRFTRQVERLAFYWMRKKGLITWKDNV